MMKIQFHPSDEFSSTYIKADDEIYIDFWNGLYEARYWGKCRIDRKYERVFSLSCDVMLNHMIRAAVKKSKL